MKIDPHHLRHLRKRKRLSRGKLAERAKISERTIQRLELEPEQSQSTRDHTLDRLATALGVDEGVLTGEMPLPPEEKTIPDPERVQIGALIAPKARLAYDLAGRRYGVSATEIINMAPLFFVLLAEGSLAWRREKLGKASEAIRCLEQVDSEIGSLVFEESAIVADNALHMERESIDRADIFGKHLFDFATGNAFASYLCKLAAELGRPGVVHLEQNDLSYGSPAKFPDYNVWKDELEIVTNGSDDARRALEMGKARLGDIPDDLIGDDGGEARAEWLAHRLPAIYKGLDEGDAKGEIARFLATTLPEDKSRLREGLLATEEADKSALDNLQTDQGVGSNG